MIRYYLYPPFLIVPEETDFSDVWEVFCLKLLKLENGSEDIERRTPPDYGVDLHYKNKSIAYQCKSVDNGSKFNITKSCKSLETALEIKNSLPWTTYIVCSNKNLTGEQEKKLKEIYNEVEVKGHDYWIGLCNKFEEQVKSNFRILVDVPKKRINSDTQLAFSQFNSTIKDELAVEPIKVLLYQERDDKIYHLPVSRGLSINSLLEMLRCLLRFNKEITENNGRIHINHCVLIDGVKYSKSDGNITLGEIGVTSKSLISHTIDITFPENGYTLNAMFLNDKEKETELKEAIIKRIYGNFYDSMQRR